MLPMLRCFRHARCLRRHVDVLRHYAAAADMILPLLRFIISLFFSLLSLDYATAL